MKIIVLGCGRMGSYLAGCLAAEGHQVMVIDRNLQAFRTLGEELEAVEGEGVGVPGIVVRGKGIRCILGLGIDEDVLKAAGIAETDAFAAVTDSDYTNIMASFIAKDIFHVPRVIIRIGEPKWEAVWRRLGLEVVCPTTLGARNIFEMLTKA